ncbi:MAG: PQQ-binding-like beta-propeller repeat protein [Planctomycetaceae bacterium]
MKVLSLVSVLVLLTGSLCHAADWPTWRGPHRDDVSGETGLLKSWPEGGPKKLWTSTEAGIGYSGVAVVDGTLFTMGADGDTEYLIALKADDGTKLWRTPVGPRLDNNWGDGPRGTPAVANGLVVGLGGRGGLVCASAADGSVNWSVELTELGGSVPGWGYTESPLIDAGRVVCTPGGGQGTVAAFDLKSGEKLWQSDGVKVGAHYSSIVPVNHYGRREYIQLTEKKIFGLAADDGQLLWEHDFPGSTAVIPTPIYKNGFVYATAGYGAGCLLLNISPQNQIEPIYENKVMKNHHGGVVLIDGHIYGYSDGPGWMCQQFDSGEMVWNERSALGKGSVTFADGRLYCLSEDGGTCVLAEASPDGWKEHGRFDLEPKSEQRADAGRVWTHPVVANGRLYLRDQEILCCYDISE